MSPPIRRAQPATRARARPRARSSWHGTDSQDAGQAPAAPDLQQTVGNQAVQRLVAQRDTATASAPPPPGGSTGGAATPAGTAVARTSRDGIDAACQAIFMGLNIGGMSSADVEIVLRTLLVQQDRIGQLRERYEQQYHRTLESDLANLTREDRLRAQQYLDHGRLTAVAKVLLALDGVGTAEEVLWRVLPDAFREGDATGAWARLVAQPLEICTRWAGLSLDAALAADLSGNDIDKARALVRFGELRPVDKIRIATNQAGTDTAMLFDGLRHADAATIHAEYEREYHENLDRVLFDQYDDEGNQTNMGELSGGEADRARALLGAASTNAAGLTNVVQACISGSNDTEILFGAVQDALTRSAGEGPAAAAARAQLAHLTARIPTTADSADPLGLTSFGGLGDGELARLKAMLGVAETSTDVPGGGYLSTDTLNDPLVRRLRALGGVDVSSVFDTLLKADRDTITALRAGFNDSGSPLHSYLWGNVTLNSGNWGELSTIFNGTLWQKLRLCAGGMRDDYEDYAYLLLDSFATDDDKRELNLALRSFDHGTEWPATQAGAALAALHGAFSTSEMTQVRNRIRNGGSVAGDMIAAAEDLEADVERERSWWFGTTDDLDDERRQLATDTTRAGLDGTLSAEEEQRLSGDLTSGRASLEAYAQLRDEITGYVSQVVQLAAGVLVTAVTGGAAGPAVAAALVRAAAASAIARVVTEKAMRGDRFDTMGADGVRAFTAGAVDGVMNVLSGGAASSVLERITKEQVEHAIQAGTASVGLRVVHSALEGGVGGAAGGMVDSVTNEDTWRNGAGGGLLVVLNSTIMSAGQGAAMSAGMTAAGAGYSSLRERMAAQGGSAAVDPTTTAEPTAHEPAAHEPAAHEPAAHEATDAGTGTTSEPTATESGGNRTAVPSASASPHAAADAGTTRPDASGTPHSAPSRPTVSEWNPWVMLARRGNDTACAALLDRLGRWEEAIAHLDQGTGPAAELSKALRDQLTEQLVAHRSRLRQHLDSAFGARPQPNASTKPGSDVDLSLSGPNAGADLIRAREWLDANHPGWDKRYRMALMIDADRVQTLSKLSGLDDATRTAANARVTREGELLSFSRRVRNADPSERANLLDRLSDPSERARVEELVAMDAATRRTQMDDAMKKGDALMARLADPNLPAAERAEIAEQVTLAQMRANALGDDAYISAGGIRGFAQNLEIASPVEHYQAAVDQVDMLIHQLHGDGGPMSAMRRYETYKYVFRFCRTLEMAGVNDPNVALLRAISEHNYLHDRLASSATAHSTRVDPAAAAAGRPTTDGQPTTTGPAASYEAPAVSDDILRSRYELMRQVIDTHLPTLRERALGGGSGTTAGGPGAAPVSAGMFSLPPLEVAGRRAGVGALDTTASPGAETGLSSHDAMIRVSASVDRATGALPAGASIDAQIGAVFRAVTVELGSTGAPRPTLVVQDLGDPLVQGLYYRQMNTIVINSGARLGGSGPLAFDATSDPTAYQRMLNVVYHESRHAEQIYRATQLEIERRVLARGMEDLPLAWAAVANDVATELQVDPAIAARASQDRLPPGSSPERSLAEEIHAETWGDPARSAHRTEAQAAGGRIRAQMEATQIAHDTAKARVDAIPWYDVFRIGERQGLEVRLAELKAELDRLEIEKTVAYQSYRDLFEERDAFAAGNRVAEYLAHRQAAGIAHDRAIDTEEAVFQMLQQVRRANPEHAEVLLYRAVEAERAWREAFHALVPLLTDDPNVVPAIGAGANP